MRVTEDTLLGQRRKALEEEFFRKENERLAAIGQTAAPKVSNAHARQDDPDHGRPGLERRSNVFGHQPARD